MIDTVTVRGKEWLPRELDFQAIMQDVADYLMKSISLNFAAGGRPNAWEVKVDGLPSTLYQSGALMRSMRTDATEDRASVFMGKGVPYAAIHQFGGYTGRNHASYIPARPYLVFQQDDIPRIVEFLKRGIEIQMASGKREVVNRTTAS